MTYVSSRFSRGLCLATLVAGAALVPQAAVAEAVTPWPAPAFTHARAEDWLNSPPRTLDSLRGQVVLIDFWAFECWNCYRSFPWLNAVEKRLAPKGLSVIGVHTPELPAERVRATLVDKLREFHIDYPVMKDDDSSYWHAFNNQYWPAFYLLDRSGRVRGAFYGETHAGDAQAPSIETALEHLLAEPAPR